MIHPVRRHPDVENDILDIAVWIGRDSREAAFRFLDSVEQTIQGLRYMPGRGSPKNLRNKRLVGLRTWWVNGFPNHLIFYEIRPGNDVYVFAVVHGRRRYASLIRKRAKGA